MSLLLLWGPWLAFRLRLMFCPWLVFLHLTCVFTCVFTASEMGSFWGVVVWRGGWGVYPPPPPPPRLSTNLSKRNIVSGGCGVGWGGGGLLRSTNGAFPVVRFPTPLDATTKDDVFVGRIRQDISMDEGFGLSLFVAGESAGRPVRTVPCSLPVSRMCGQGSRGGTARFVDQVRCR